MKRLPKERRAELRKDPLSAVGPLEQVLVINQRLAELTKTLFMLETVQPSAEQKFENKVSYTANPKRRREPSQAVNPLIKFGERVCFAAALDGWDPHGLTHDFEYVKKAVMSKNMVADVKVKLEGARYTAVLVLTDGSWISSRLPRHSGTWALLDAFLILAGIALSRRSEVLRAEYRKLRRDELPAREPKPEQLSKHQQAKVVQFAAEVDKIADDDDMSGLFGLQE